MSLEQFLSAIFQVATGLVLATWAIVGVAVSTYYAYKVAQNLITRRARVIGKLKKSKLFSLYEKGGKSWDARKAIAKSK
ncbi:MAG TPA: hypothetical protein VLH56_01710 [Dissulfurispiraceae bacterium]|nr:hypothetical protein [Dissulfurispiraceae bacterium]